jgi:hypothetical protein
MLMMGVAARRRPVSGGIMADNRDRLAVLPLDDRTNAGATSSTGKDTA